MRKDARTSDRIFPSLHPSLTFPSPHRASFDTVDACHVPTGESHEDPNQNFGKMNPVLRVRGNKVSAMLLVGSEIGLGVRRSI